MIRRGRTSTGVIGWAVTWPTSWEVSWGVKGHYIRYLTNLSPTVVTIFFSVKLPKAELPEWMDWILVSFVVVHVLVHLIFSVSKPVYGF